MDDLVYRIPIFFIALLGILFGGTLAMNIGFHMLNLSHNPMETLGLWFIMILGFCCVISGIYWMVKATIRWHIL